MQKRSVYLMKSGDYYKIGISYDVDQRAIDIARGGVLSPELTEPINVVFSKEVNNASDVEIALHARCKDYRIIGEWFRLPEEEVSRIVSSAEQGFSDLVCYMSVHKTTGFRLSPEMRALLERIGGGNITAGFRALVIIGAYHSGEPIHQLQMDYGTALAAPLADKARAELNRVQTAPQSATPPPEPSAEDDSADDMLFGDIGIKC